jgi:hypothetical protein
MHVVGTEAVSSPSEKQVAYDWKKRVTAALLEIPKGEKRSLRELSEKADVPLFDEEDIRTLGVHMSALAIRGIFVGGFSRDGGAHVHRYTDSNIIETYQARQRRKAVRSFMRVVGSAQTVDEATLDEVERRRLQANVTHAQAMVLFSTPANRRRIAETAKQSADVRDTLALFSGNSDE